jgi:hypothetical protein
MSRKKAATSEEEIVDILKNILIVQLGLAKVPQNDIRKILGCDMGRVSGILKHLPKINR